MHIGRCSNTELESKCSEAEVVICFGISKCVEKYCALFGDNWMDYVGFIVDNDTKKQGSIITFGKKQFKVMAPKEIVDKKNGIIIITTQMKSCVDIIKQLIDLNIDDSISCYSLMRIVDEEYSDDVLEKYLENHVEEKIPRIIHACWLSGEKKPREYTDCIESWKKYCTGYEIMEWTSENYDIAKNKYVKAAYDKRKWALASDYIRLDVVYNYGGIYLDMDVELLKRLDPLLRLNSFFAIDNIGYIDLGSGFGATSRNDFIKSILDLYEGISFNDEEEWFGVKGIVSQPKRIIGVFEKIGFSHRRCTQLLEGNMLLSPNYFRVMDDHTHSERDITGNEYGLHWHNASWKSDDWREERLQSKQTLKRCIEKYDDMVDLYE